MIRSRRPCHVSARRLSWLRALLAAWLLLGLALQPALAAACDIGDASRALAGEAGNAAPPAADDAAQSAVQADGADGVGSNDCCANPACGDCCLTATASLPAQALAVHVMPGTMPGMHPAGAFAPRQTPVDNPPPIEG